MPTYDYECTGCGKHHRAQHSMSADKPDCPDCGAELKQVFLVAPAVNGADSGGKGESSAPACPTGTCPFMNS